MEIWDDAVEKPDALMRLMYDLPFQMQDEIAKDLRQDGSFYEPYFAVDRTSTAGIATADGRIVSYLMDEAGLIIELEVTRR